MRRLKYFVFVALVVSTLTLVGRIASPTPAFAAVCPGTGAQAPDGDVRNCPPQAIPGSSNTGCAPVGSVLGLPTWYRHLDGQIEQPNPNEASTCQVKIKGLTDIWKVVAALIEALLRIASLVAIGFVVFGGVTYITSQGSPDKTKAALSTIISSLVGLTITIVASAVVGFIAGRF